MRLIKSDVPFLPQRFLTVLLFSPLALLASLNLSGADLKVGFAEFSRQSPGFSPAAAALFRLTNPEGILVSEAGVGTVSPVRRGRILVQRTESVQTGVAFANSSEQPIFLRLILRSESGQELDRIEPFELGAYQHLARFVEQLFAGVPSSFLGSLSFEGIGANDRVSAVTIRQSQNLQNEPLLATLPVVDLDSQTFDGGTFIFPHLGAGPGFVTQLVLINTASEVAAGQIHLISSNGGPLQLQLVNGVGSVVSFMIPANGVFLTELNLPPGVELGVGYARVEATQGEIPSGTAIFRYVENQQPISEAGVAPSLPMGKARLFVDRRDTATGFALVNPNSTSMTLHLRLYDGNGSLVGEVEHLLAAKTHLAKFASEFFTLPDQFVGLLEIESDRDFVPITLKLSQNSRNQSILTTLPVADLSRPDSRESLVAPQLGAGESGVGDFETSLIFIAPLQEDRVIGSLSFWQGEGQPLELGSLRSEFLYAMEAGAAGEIRLADQAREPILRKGNSVSASIGPEGGQLFLDGCAGSSIDLDIPPFALLEAREISLTCLESRPISTLGSEVFPGVGLEPGGLVFREPVQLTVQLPKPLEDPVRTALLGLGLDHLPEAVFGAVTDGRLITGDLLHFSEYWAEQMSLSDLMTWSERLKTEDPEQRQKALEYFKRQAGDLEVSDLTLELLVEITDFFVLKAFENWKDVLDAPSDSGALGYLDQLVTKLLTSPNPSDACDYYQGAALWIRELSEAYLGSNPNLNSHIAQLDSQCIRVELTGLWRAGQSSGSERCIRDSEPVDGGCVGHGCGILVTDVFNEPDYTESFLFSITQSGSSFTVTFPGFPDAPALHGHLRGTGNEEFPYAFSIPRVGSDSVDCKKFFETDGEFDFGDPLCQEFVPEAECEALSCWERQLLRGRVNSTGRILEGSERWTLLASVHDRPGGCCSFKTYLDCRGSQPFSASKQ